MAISSEVGRIATPTTYRTSSVLWTLLAALSLCPCVAGQTLAPVNAARREAVVSRITELLEQKYLLPDVGKECGDYITQRLTSGAYNGITDQKAFAKQLTTDLRGVSHDQHINVWTHPAGHYGQQEVDLETARWESQE